MRVSPWAYRKAGEPISSPEPAFLLVSTKNANLWANPNEATFDWLVKACLFHGPEAIFRREIEIWEFTPPDTTSTKVAKKKKKLLSLL